MLMVATTDARTSAAAKSSAQVVADARDLVADFIPIPTFFHLRRLTSGEECANLAISFSSRKTRTLAMRQRKGWCPMIMGDQDGLAAEIAALQEKMAALQTRMQAEGACPMRPSEAERARRIAKRPVRGGKEPKTQHRIGRVTIAPGITLTTLPNSMYSTMAKAMARAGCLERHDDFFNAFLRKPTATSALNLLRDICISRTELNMFVRASQEFLEHCDDRTRQLKNALATGSASAKAKARRVLKNPKICDGHGHWIGD